MMKDRRRYSLQKAFLISVAIITMLIAITGEASAQQSESQSGLEIANLFTWATNDPPDWSQGLLYSFLGMIGALVTIFTLIGGVIPGTAGQAKIEFDEGRLDKWQRRLEELMDDPSPNAEVIKSVEVAVDNLRDDLRAERWHQFGIAAVIYVVLGAFFSALLAQDMLQALVIGAGWTGFIGTLGLKKDYEGRKSAKDAFLDRKMLEIKELEEKLRKKGVTSEKMVKEILPGAVYVPDLGKTLGKIIDFEKDFSIVRSL